MPAEILARCLRCHALKPHSAFPITQMTRDPKTKKKRVVRDTYCNDCRPYITATIRRADLRDPKPPDR